MADEPEDIRPRARIVVVLAAALAVRPAHERLLLVVETLINGQRNEIGDDGGDCLRRAIQNNSAITWLSLRVRRALAMDSNDI